MLASIRIRLKRRHLFTLLLLSTVLLIQSAQLIPFSSQSMLPTSQSTNQSDSMAEGATSTSTTFSNISIPADWPSWRTQIAHIPPPQAGCFTVAYPSTIWQPIQCVSAHAPPLQPSPATVGGASSAGVGNGIDEVAQSSGTKIGSSIGTFATTGLTSETDVCVGPPPFCTSGGEGTNAYSLQINSQFFTTSTTYTGSKSTTGWEQFVFYNSPSVNVECNCGVVYIQYWLILYHSSYGTCPSTGPPGGSGWMQSGSDCYANSPLLGTPLEAATNLASLTLEGFSDYGSSGNDVNMLCVSGGSCYSVTVTEQVLNLNLNWFDSEFNVFGASDGSQAQFNSGAGITVTNTLKDQSAHVIVPSCVNTGYTGETNNLDLVSCFSNKNGQIAFTESNVSPCSDEFSYANVAALQSAGWTVTNPSYVSVDGSTVQLDNDGTTGAVISRSCPAMLNWRVEARGEWVGRTYGTLSIVATTTYHSYNWLLDGQLVQYSLSRDGTKVITQSGYSPQLNVYATFAVQKYGNSITVYANGNFIATYTETDTRTDPLIGIGINSGFITTSKYDYIHVTSPTFETLSILSGFTSDSTGSILLETGDIAISPHGTKPPGVGYQQGRDTTPLGFISGMLSNTQPNSFDTNPNNFDTSGRPIGSWSLIMAVGGPFGNAVPHYYETTTTTADNAPVSFSQSGGNDMWTDRNGNVVASVPVSSVSVPPGTSDVFAIQILRDSGGRLVVLMYGTSYLGVWAAAYYFKYVIYPNISAYTNNYYIIRWTDASSGQYADFIPDSGDAFTVIAQGTA